MFLSHTLPVSVSLSSINFLKDFIYLLLERGEGREKEEEKHQCVAASHMPPAGDLASDPGMCPEWESNWRPFGSQAGTQSTEPHQPGLSSITFLKRRETGTRTGRAAPWREE